MTEAGGARLTVIEHLGADRIGTWQPKAGGVFAALTFELRNVSSDRAFPLASSLFALRTKGGLVLVPAPPTFAFDPCPTASLELGGAVKCSVVFETEPDAATELVYTLPTAERMVARVPQAEACTGLRPQGAVLLPRGEVPARLPADKPLADGTFVLDEYGSATKVNQMLPAGWTLRLRGLGFEAVIADAQGGVRRIAGEVQSDSMDLSLVAKCESPKLTGTEPSKWFFNRSVYEPSTKRLTLQEFDVNNLAKAVMLHLGFLRVD